MISALRTGWNGMFDYVESKGFELFLQDFALGLEREILQKSE